MRTDRANETYWTLIQNTGKILRLPRTLRRVLNSQDWKFMSIQSLNGQNNQILLKSDQKIAAFRVSMEGRLIDSVEFDREAEDGPNMIADSILGNYKD